MNAMAKFSDFTDPDLGTVLILSPDTDLACVREALCVLGFDSHVETDGTHAAAFSYRGGRPHVIYSHNPVVDLHVLDVGTAPPALRRAICQSLPYLSRASIASDVNAADERIALRAIWAAVETERVDLIETLSQVAGLARGVVAAEAARASERLGEVDSARINVVGGVRLVATAAVDLTREMMRRSVAQALLIRPEDAADVFTADIASVIAENLADAPIDLGKGVLACASDDGAITATPAGLLRFDNMLSRPFPQAYRSCAGWLIPDRIWLTWKVEDSNHGSIRYDGLVFTGERWLFCPRPFRLIEAALGQAG